MIEYSITCDKLVLTPSGDFFGIVAGVLGPIAAIIFFIGLCIVLAYSKNNRNNNIILINRNNNSTAL